MCDDYKVPTTDNIPNDYIIYNDDYSFGKTAPELSTVKYIHLGDSVDETKAKAILFWGKAFKGEYETIVAFSKLSEKYKEIQFIGISIDAEESEALKFVSKLGTAMPEQNITCLEANFPLAFDTNKSVKESFQQISRLSSIPASMLYLINTENQIIWRERMNSKAYPLQSSMFEGQIQQFLANKVLHSNGTTPIVEEEEEECVSVPNDALDAFADY